MNSHDEYSERLDLARRYLAEAELVLQQGHRRPSASSSQEAAENAGKAALSLFAAVAKTHDVHAALEEALKGGAVPDALRARVEELVKLCKPLGAEEHVVLTYGDAKIGKNPWQVADEGRARRNLDWARRAVKLAEELRP